MVIPGHSCVVLEKIVDGSFHLPRVKGVLNHVISVFPLN